MSTPTVQLPGTDRRSFFRWLAAGPLSVAAVTVARAANLLPIPSRSPQLGTIELPPPDEFLEPWLSAPRLPILDSEEPKERHFIRAIRLRQTADFAYLGGTAPGAVRTVHPVMLFRVEGFPGTYLTVYCQTRQEIRTFRLDRIKVTTPG